MTILFKRPLFVHSIYPKLTPHYSKLRNKICTLQGRPTITSVYDNSNSSRRVACLVQYIGTNFSGWERKPDLQTVQATIEDAIHDITQNRIKIQAASRTDARTHAAGQVFHFDTFHQFNNAHAWIKAINNRLPSQILVQNAQYVPLSFDARKSALWRSYRYSILTSKKTSVFLRDFVWHYYQKPLDIELMNHAARLLKSSQSTDFSAFRKTRASATHTMITIYDASVTRSLRNPDIVEINICASWFVYGMMRLLTATLIQVGTGQLCIDKFVDIVRNGHRHKVQFSAPACGLCLMQVGYPSALNFFDSKMGFDISVGTLGLTS